MIRIRSLTRWVRGEPFASLLPSVFIRVYPWFLFHSADGVCMRNQQFLQPQRAVDDSPGQRPGNRNSPPIQALKGRNNDGRRLCVCPLGRNMADLTLLADESKLRSNTDSHGSSKRAAYEELLGERRIILKSFLISVHPRLSVVPLPCIIVTLVGLINDRADLKIILAKVIQSLNALRN